MKIEGIFDSLGLNSLGTSHLRTPKKFDTTDINVKKALLSLYTGIDSSLFWPDVAENEYIPLRLTDAPIWQAFYWRSKEEQVTIYLLPDTLEARATMGSKEVYRYWCLLEVMESDPKKLAPCSPWVPNDNEKCQRHVQVNTCPLGAMLTGNQL